MKINPISLSKITRNNGVKFTGNLKNIQNVADEVVLNTVKKPPIEVPAENVPKFIEFLQTMTERTGKNPYDIFKKIVIRH